MNTISKVFFLFLRNYCSDAIKYLESIERQGTIALNRHRNSENLIAKMVPTSYIIDNIKISEDKHRNSAYIYSL